MTLLAGLLAIPSNIVPLYHMLLYSIKNVKISIEPKTGPFLSILELLSI